MIVDLQDIGPETEAATDANADAYNRNTRWALADFECEHGQFAEECERCQFNARFHQIVKRG